MMSAILSLSRAKTGLWASGPEGLLLYQNGMAEPILQPQEQLYCSASTEDVVLVGGLPHGIAFSADGIQWQSAYVDEVTEAVLCIAPDPSYLESGVMLAGTAGGGLLRTDDRGRHWSLCNFGLENFTILSVAWAAPAEPGTWPLWEVSFAATEDGLYRSPNGGLGWRRCIGTQQGVFVAIAASVNFHQDGLVLAGTEDSGLWRSCDGGRSFEQVPDAPQQINALLNTPFGWFIGNNDGIYRSDDGDHWTPLPDSSPALTLLEDGNDLWAGTEDGIVCFSLERYL